MILSFMNDLNHGPSSPLIGRKDLISLAALTAAYLAMLLGSWQRWNQPLIDHGREMNLPARILAGERLYLDVHFLYGPFAPNFNAFLYRIFGDHLSTLQASGAITGALILLSLYLIARQLMGVWESTAAVGLALVICALKSTANYVQPYAFAALYGLAFALFSLTAVLRYLRSSATAVNRGPWQAGLFPLILAGLFAGMALISKWEIALAALASGAAALIVVGFTHRRIPLRESIAFFAPALAAPLVAYAIVLSRVPPRTLLIDNRILFTNMPPQLVYFNGLISGLGDLPRSIFFTLGGLGVFAIWIGIVLMVAAIAKGAGRKRALKLGLAFLLGGALWRELSIRVLGISASVTPLASGAIVLPLVLAVCIIILWKRKDHPPFAFQGLLVIAAFSFLSILRVIVNVKIASPYTPFFTPVLIVVYLYLLMHAAPALLVAEESRQRLVRRAALALIIVMAIVVGVDSVRRLHRYNTFRVYSVRGSFLTSPEIGAPLQQAIEYVEQNTRPEDFVLTLPQATTINFLAHRRTPFQEEIVHPGFLAGEHEEDAIRMIERTKPPLIVIAALDTPEFRDRTFGVDYNLILSKWIHDHYRFVTRYDPPPGTVPDLDGRPFYILIYAKDPAPISKRL